MDRMTELIAKLRNMDVKHMGITDGITVSRAINVYNNTHSDELAAVITSMADKLVEAGQAKTEGMETAEYPSPWCLLYAAYRINPKEELKNKIIELEKSDIYMGLCFDMNYETMFGGKEKYHDITVQFGRLAAAERITDMDKAAFMMALIDTIAAIDQPVYELYRSLVDIFRDELRAIVDKAWEREQKTQKGNPHASCRLLDNPEAEKVLACAIKKACAMKVVLAEKYEKYVGAGCC